MFGTGLERLWSRLSFWLRHHAALREGLHSDRTIIRTLCSACTRARWWWNCEQGDHHSATLPPTLRFVLLIPRMLLCMASGPHGPRPPPQYIFASTPSSTCKRIANNKEKGVSGVSALGDLVGMNSSKAISSSRPLYMGLAGPLSCPPGQATAHSHTTHGISLISVDEGESSLASRTDGAETERSILPWSWWRHQTSCSSREMHSAMKNKGP